MYIYYIFLFAVPLKYRVISSIFLYGIRLSNRIVGSQQGIFFDFPQWGGEHNKYFITYILINITHSAMSSVHLCKAYGTHKILKWRIYILVLSYHFLLKPVMIKKMFFWVTGLNTDFCYKKDGWQCLLEIENWRRVPENHIR